MAKLCNCNLKCRGWCYGYYQLYWYGKVGEIVVVFFFFFFLSFDSAILNFNSLCSSFANLLLSWCSEMIFIHRYRQEIPELLYHPVMVSSAMELHLRCSGLCRPNTRGNKLKQNTSTIFACHAAFHACLSSRSDCIWQITVILIEGKTLIPNWSPMPRIKIAQVLGSPVCICVFTCL